jgi:hypothetical protein
MFKMTKQEIRENCNSLIQREKIRKRFQDVLNISSNLFILLFFYFSSLAAIGKDFNSIVYLTIAYLLHYVVIHYLQLLTDKVYFKPYFATEIDGFIQVYVMESVKVERLPIKNDVKAIQPDYKIVPVDRHVLDLYRTNYNGDVDEDHELMLSFLGVPEELREEFKDYVNKNASARRSYTQD